MFRLIKLTTMAGLVGLAILNPKPFSRIITGGSTAFRNAVKVAP